MKDVGKRWLQYKLPIITITDWRFPPLQISNRSARSVALPEVGGGEDGAQGGGVQQLLPDQAGPDESLSDETLSQQVGQEQLQKSTGKLPPLLQQGKRSIFQYFSIFQYLSSSKVRDQYFSKDLAAYSPRQMFPNSKKFFNRYCDIDILDDEHNSKTAFLKKYSEQDNYLSQIYISQLKKNISLKIFLTTSTIQRQIFLNKNNLTKETIYRKIFLKKIFWPKIFLKKIFWQTSTIQRKILFKKIFWPTNISQKDILADEII